MSVEILRYECRDSSVMSVEILRLSVEILRYGFGLFLAFRRSDVCKKSSV